VVQHTLLQAEVMVKEEAVVEPLMLVVLVVVLKQEYLLVE
jgi:hypothetical protein